MSFKEVKELRQAGKLDDALKMATQDLGNDSENIWNKRSIAWVYNAFLKDNASPEKYDSFKEFLEELSSLNLPSNENMVFDNCAYNISKIVFAFQKHEKVDYSKLNEIFELIKEFHFTKPSESYSVIYKAFHKGYKNWSKYLEFADWWDFENFRSEDYLKNEFNGRQIMAMVEQAYIAYAKKTLEGEDEFYETEQGLHIYQGKKVNKEKIDEFLPKIEKLNHAHPEYQYPAYFIAKLLLGLGNKENTLTAFLPFAKKKKNDFWVWDLMADVFIDDEEKRLACLCKALSLRSPEDFLINVHQKLAVILVKKELYNEARTEIEKLIKTREEHDWKISENVKNWTNQTWYNSAVSGENNKNFYKQYIGIAEEILFQDVPEEIIVVEFVNTNKKVLNFIKDKNKRGFFSYERFLHHPKIGNILKVRFAGDGKDGFFKILSAQITEEPAECPAIKIFEGNIRINAPNKFGFLDDVFVSPDIVEIYKLENNQIVRIKAILSFNKKKAQWGWKAFKTID